MNPTLCSVPIYKTPTLSDLGLQLLGHLIFKDVEIFVVFHFLPETQIFNSSNLTDISHINDLPENQYQLLNWEIKAYTEDGVFSYLIILKKVN